MFYDLEGKEIEEPLDVLDPSCCSKSDYVIENINDFIHVGKHKWDVIFYDGDPIYKIEGHLQSLPLQQPCIITTNSYLWQYKDDMITHLFEIPKDDLMQHFHNDFFSYLEDFDTYPYEHLDLLYEEDLQPPLCFDSDESNDMVFARHELHDENFHPSFIPSSHYVTKYTARKHGPCPKFSLGKSFLLEFKGRLNFLRSLVPRYLGLSLRSC